MNTAWVFIEICIRSEKGQSTHIAELQKIYPEAKDERYKPTFEYEGVTNWRSGSIQREIDYLIKWGLVEKRQDTNKYPHKGIILLVPTELGFLAWLDIVRPLREKKKVWPFNYVLSYTNSARVTELVPVSINPPRYDVQLDPILPATLPIVRELLEEVRDKRPWLYAFATGKLLDEIMIRWILRRQALA